MTINYSDIFEKAQMFSSFEGGRLYDGNGETLFPVVNITDQDSDLISEYSKQAVNQIASTLRFAIDSTTITDSVYTLTFVTDTALNTNRNTTQHIQEAIVAYVMEKWLENKSPERSASYKQIFTDMLGTLVHATNRVRPTLDDSY